MSWPPVRKDAEWMKIILLVLNAVHPRSAVQRKELRRMVAAWDSVRRDIEKALKALPELDPYLYDQEGRPSRRVAFVPEGSGFEIVPEPLESAGNGLYIIPPAHIPGVTPITEEKLEKHRARVMFTRLLFNELRDSLAGPCLQCDKYWARKPIKSGGYSKFKLYCSRPCQQKAAAYKSTKNRQQREHADKLQRAGRAANYWSTARTKDDWKAFVSKREPDITPKFLTRAVNKGELKLPTKKGR